MKNAIIASLALAASVAAAPAPAASPATTAAPAAAQVKAASALTVSGNIFSLGAVYVDPYYASEVSASALPTLTGTLAAKASEAADTGSFVWLDTAAKVPSMDTYLTNIEGLNAAGTATIGAFIVYDLPDRDCAALASNGEYTIADDGVNHYKAYIDSIAAVIKKHASTPIALVIEPDSLANLVTNQNVAKCANAQDAYLECFQYALTNLNFPNVASYIDAGHAGWLGWPANIGPAATLFSEVYKNASNPSQVRGLATNVANYNAWSIATCPSYTSGDSNCDENRYINALAPLLTQNGFPAHFITDTGRNGKQPTGQNAWGDWCNVKGTGFGAKPTTNTGNSLSDAFMWIKPPGESDGTSNTSAARYDAHCGLSDALQGAPEAGTWFEAAFEMYLTNAAW